MRRNNRLLVDRLLSALAVAEPRPRLVQLGSVHEYTPQPNGVWLNESSPEEPTTDYGRTKLQGSRAVLRAVEKGAVDAVVLRLSNVIGAGTPRDSLLGQVAAQLLDDAADGGARRCGCHRCAASATSWTPRMSRGRSWPRCASPAPHGHVLNIASGASQHVRDMVDLLITLSGR